MTSIDAENCCLRWTRSSSTIIKLMKKALRKLTTSATFSDIPYWTNWISMNASNHFTSSDAIKKLSENGL